MVGRASKKNKIVAAKLIAAKMVLRPLKNRYRCSYCEKRGSAKAVVATSTAT